MPPKKHSEYGGGVSFCNVSDIALQEYIAFTQEMISSYKNEGRKDRIDVLTTIFRDLSNELCDRGCVRDHVTIERLGVPKPVVPVARGTVKAPRIRKPAKIISVKRK